MEKAKLLGIIAASCISLWGCSSGDLGKISGCRQNMECGDTDVYRCDILKNECVEIDPKHCHNGQQDEDETGVDCGGSCGPLCKFGEGCEQAGDCASLVCDDDTHKCDDRKCTNDAVCLASKGKCIFEKDASGAAKAEGKCSTCVDGIANGDESDIDCGGLCGATCDVGKKCLSSADCKDKSCKDGVCIIDTSIKAKLSDLVINEVMSDPATGETPFATHDSGMQCDFVEIVNLSTHDVKIDGVTLHIKRTDDGKGTTSDIALAGIIKAKSAAVVISQVCGYQGPDDVLVIDSGTQNFLTANPAAYDLSLMLNGETKNTTVSYKWIKKGVSSNRKPDTSAAGELVEHSSVDNANLSNSPGYCANGGIFSEGCVTSCTNNILDDNETDVDCGGICPKCAEGKKCTIDDNCLTGFCNAESGTCTYINCALEEDCLPLAGFLCIDGKCQKPETCSDGIKNQNETDVDCGGTCRACDVNKACLTNHDCITNECTKNVCTGSKPENASANDLLINEVMAAEDTTASSKSFFVLNGNAKECKFIEIVNISSQAVTLDGCKAVLTRTDTTGKASSTALSGSLKSKNVLIVGYNCDANMILPPTARLNDAAMASTNNVTQSGAYTAHIECGDSKSTEFIVPSAVKGTSMNLSHDLDSSNTTMVSHKDVAGNDTPASPGFCANGGTFVNDCKDGASEPSCTPSDSTANCGGTCPNKCDAGKACNSSTDCMTGICTAGRCEDEAACEPSDTAVNCGGTCTVKCAVGRSCTIASDCQSNFCDANVCANNPDAPEPTEATVNDLMFNEIMAAPDTKKNFEFPSSTVQQEFVELVNKTDKTLTLDKLTLMYAKTTDLADSSKYKKIVLSGTAAAHGAVVVSTSVFIEKPEDGIHNIPSLPAIANNTEFEFWLKSDTEESAHVTGIKDNMTRAADIDESSAFTKISNGGTPGYCANGKRFIDSCR